MSELKEKFIPNEVIVVGKKRDENDKEPVDVNLVGKELAKAILAKYKFIRETAPSKEATQAGILTGKFMHIRVSDSGGAKVMLSNGKTVRASSKTTEFGFDNVFESQRAVTFNEIKQEIIELRFEPLAGDPNCGQIKLTEFALIGYWDEFPMGFDFYPHFFDVKNGNKLVPLMAARKQDDGSFKKEQAIANMGRHLVYENEIDNLETLRDNIRKKNERFKVPVKTVNTDDRGTTAKGEGDQTPVNPPAPAGAKADDDV